MGKRFKSAKYVYYPPLAFRVFGEVRPRHTMFVLPVWDREGAAPHEIVCPSVAVAAAVRERMTMADLEAYEMACRLQPSTSEPRN